MAGYIAEGSIPPGHAAPAQEPCRWLISLDFDGTLRNEEGPAITPDFFRQMADWRCYGVRWGINTGRTLDYLLQEIIPCSPVLPDFICTCERYVYMAGNDGRLLPAKEHNTICLERNLTLRRDFTPTLHATLQQLRCTRPDLQWEHAAEDPLSIEAIDSKTMDDIIPYLTPLITPTCTIQRAGRYLRFSDVAFSKGTALRYIMEEWKVDEQQLFIMGDGHNDLDAFRLFPQAFCAAPSTAHPEVIDWLQQQPNSYLPTEAGVLPALRKWFCERVSGAF